MDEAVYSRDLENLKNPPILILNNDCLLKIFSYFDIVELIDLETVCERFFEVIREEYKIRRMFDYREVQSKHGKDQMTLELVTKIAERIGPYLHTLYFDSISSKNVVLQFATMLGQCTNLEYLNIDDEMSKLLSDATIQELLVKRSGKLRKVNLKGSYDYVGKRYTTLHDGNTQFLQQVTSLSLSYIDVHGMWFTNLPNLKEFIVQRVHGGRSDFGSFLTFCERQTTLEVLKIVNCDFFNDSCLEAITKHLRNLRCLEIQCGDKLFSNLRSISDLPHLTEIVILGPRPIQNLLDGLIVRNVLESLHIFIPENLDLGQVLQPLSKIRNLKSLGIRCANFTDDDFVNLPPSTTNTLEYLNFNLSSITDDGVCYLVRRYEFLKTLYMGKVESLPENLAVKLQSILTDRAHCLMIYLARSYENTNMPNINVPNLTFKY
ncbi:hypothetical protein DMENIID0001_138410 [Sergentomyia squamirostris]